MIWMCYETVWWKILYGVWFDLENILYVSLHTGDFGVEIAL